MDLLEKLNGPLDYIEKNLANNIDFKEVAMLASCSESYFRRLFFILVGSTLSEYIRCRRLTLAAFELDNRNMSISDIALKYGYHSPDSFTRAFQDFHGVTPSEARIYGRWLKAYTRMTFQPLVSKEDNHEAEDKEDIYRKQ